MIFLIDNGRLLALVKVRDNRRPSPILADISLRVRSGPYRLAHLERVSISNYGGKIHLQPRFKKDKAGKWQPVERSKELLSNKQIFGDLTKIMEFLYGTHTINAEDIHPWRS